MHRGSSIQVSGSMLPAAGTPAARYTTEPALCHTDGTCLDVLTFTGETTGAAAALPAAVPRPSQTPLDSLQPSGTTAEPTAEAGRPTAGCTDAPVVLNGTRSSGAAAAATPPQPPSSPGPAAPSSQPPHGERNVTAGASSGPPPTAFAAMMAASRSAGYGALSPKSPHRWDCGVSDGWQPSVVAGHNPLGCQNIS